jgi:hypothetical protein
MDKKGGITLGQLFISYGENGVYEKKTVLEQNYKYVFIKASIITKEVPKKDLV